MLLVNCVAIDYIKVIKRKYPHALLNAEAKELAEKYMNGKKYHRHRSDKYPCLQKATTGKGLVCVKQVKQRYYCDVITGTFFVEIVRNAGKKILNNPTGKKTVL